MILSLIVDDILKTISRDKDEEEEEPPSFSCLAV